MSSTNRRIVVAGGGTVGPFAALFLKRAGFDVTLLEEGEYIGGAGAVAAVFHATGCEYPLDPTGRTGRDCVLGGVTARLCLPDAVFTDVATADNPVRFLVAAATAAAPTGDAGRLTESQFDDHAAAMTGYYAELSRRVVAGRRWSAAAAARRLEGIPETFIRKLPPEAYADARGIAVGYAAAGRGHHPPTSAALVAGQLDELGVDVLTSRTVERVLAHGSGYRLSTSDGGIYDADVVVVAAGNQSSGVAHLFGAGPTLTYTSHLNLATYVRLPPGAEARITFTLLGYHGGMCAALEPTAPGRRTAAMLYLPAPYGSQYATCVIDPATGQATPPEWAGYIRDGIPDADERGGAVLRHLTKLYPCLAGATVERVVARAVVNPHGPAREIRRGDHPNEIAPGLVTIVGTKWTNSLTAAIEATHHVQRYAHARGWIAAKELLFPTAGYKLDVSEHVGTLPDLFSLREARIEPSVVTSYSTHMRLPDKNLGRDKNADDVA